MYQLDLFYFDPISGEFLNYLVCTDQERHEDLMDELRELHDLGEDVW